MIPERSEGRSEAEKSCPKWVAIDFLIEKIYFNWVEDIFSVDTIEHNYVMIFFWSRAEEKFER